MRRCGFCTVLIHSSVGFPDYADAFLRRYLTRFGVNQASKWSHRTLRLSILGRLLHSSITEFSPQGLGESSPFTSKDGFIVRDPRRINGCAKAFWPNFLESNARTKTRQPLKARPDQKERAVNETTYDLYKLIFSKSTKLPSTYRSFIPRFLQS